MILRCELCNKPFDKQSTMKRHGYYCRSRKNGKPIRPLSCIGCARSKARCDNRRPHCSRCLAKSINCQYPSPQKNKEASFSSISSVLGSPNTHTSPKSNDARDEAPALDIPLVTPEDIDPFSWEVPEIEFSDLLNMSSMINEELDVAQPAPEVSLVRHSLPAANTVIQMPHLEYASDFNFPLPPIPIDTHRALVLRSNPRPGAQKVVKLILHTLKSYPQIMMHDKSLPPFIHPDLTSPNFANKDMESFHNCVSLMHMISREIQCSRKLFWKNVRLECERMIDKCIQFDGWELLAAMTALCIYILQRMGEGETEHNNVDTLLYAAMLTVARQFTLRDLTYNPAFDTDDIKSCWRDWIYLESRRRLGVVFRIINMLVYFDASLACSLQSGFVLPPLPARKQLWEAPDEIVWKAERNEQPFPRSAFGLNNKGDLVRLDESILYGGCGVLEAKELGGKSSSENWEEWCAGMDSFGGLIMLAASLVD